MLIKVVVVDDEQAAIDVLVHHISRTPSLELKAAFREPLQAIEYMNQHKIDLLFCDIEMPPVNGMDVIRALHKNVAVILITAYTEYAVNAYDLNVIDYLVKPIGYPRFLQAIQKIKAPHTLPAVDHFFVKSGVRGGLVKINIADITHIEGAKNYIQIYHGTVKTITLMNLKDMEAVLPANQFLRVHKSSIIAINRIIGIEGELLLLSDGQKVIIGPSYKHSVMELIRNNLLGD